MALRREEASFTPLTPEQREATRKEQAEALQRGREARSQIAQGVVDEGATKVLMPHRPKELTERQVGIHLMAAQFQHQGGNTEAAKETLERAGVEVRVVDSSKPEPVERKSPLDGMSIEQIIALGEVEVPDLDDEDDFNIWDEEDSE